MTVHQFAGELRGFFRGLMSRQQTVLTQGDEAEPGHGQCGQDNEQAAPEKAGLPSRSGLGGLASSHCVRQSSRSLRCGSRCHGAASLTSGRWSQGRLFEKSLQLTHLGPQTRRLAVLFAS